MNKHRVKNEGVLCKACLTHGFDRFGGGDERRRLGTDEERAPGVALLARKKQQRIERINRRPNIDEHLAGAKRD